MALTPAITPARALLDIITLLPGRAIPTNAQADKAMSDFLADIIALDLQHNRGKILTQDQLAEQIFRSRPVFKDYRSMIPYLRYQLRVAVEELSALDKTMRNKNGGALTFATLSEYGDFIRDYLFDLREILTVLQQKVSGWTFFSGIKNPGVDSWEMFILANNLAYQSTVKSGVTLSHKPAQIASIFVLRQAMELRFERLVSVYPTDRKGKPPKLRHGFHQEFIAANPQLFLASGFEVKKLRHLYDWCSEIVHQAYQPYIWQTTMALRRAGNLLRARPLVTGQPWSIHNAVEIKDTEAMQTAYEEHFLASYGHGVWKMTREKPEALTPNWQPNMAFTAPKYRPVTNKPCVLRRAWTRLVQLCRRCR